jgi:hypothetical protein
MNGIDLSILLSERLPKCHTLLFSGQALTRGPAWRKLGKRATRSPKPVHPSLLDTAVKVLTAYKEKQI